VSEATTERNERLPAWLIPPYLIGATLALAGGFWDDAWHTERGRDSFFIAPHLAIYSGITLVGGALGVWALATLCRRGWAALIADRSLRLALLSVAVTLASAPVDNFWHVAFGRDAVIWSPPHVLGIVGTAGLSTAVLVELTRSPAAWAPPLRWVAGALLLAAFSFLVVEYDTDVPQFAVVWYLPVLALGSSLALALVRLATRERLAATRAATVHFAFFGLVALFLLVQGFDTPKAPLILASAIVLDLGAQRRLPLAAQAALYAVALYAVYLPALDLLGHGVRLGAGDVAVGLPLSALAVGVVLAVTNAQPRSPSRAPRLVAAGVLTLALLVAITAPALAHDPGQGKRAGTLDIAAQLSGRSLTVVARRDQGDCAQLTPVGIVARRAGRVERSALRRSGCEFRGVMQLSDEGRWFIYLDARKHGETVESWIPVKVDEAQHRFTARRRFAYVADRKPATAPKWAAGGVMYALVIAFLVAIVSLVRSASAEHMRSGGSGPPQAVGDIGGGAAQA
jgi:hypothetical protein